MQSGGGTFRPKWGGTIQNTGELRFYFSDKSSVTDWSVLEWAKTDGPHWSAAGWRGREQGLTLWRSSEVTEWKSHLNRNSQPNCSRSSPRKVSAPCLHLPLPPNIYWLPAKLIPKQHSPHRAPQRDVLHPSPSPSICGKPQWPDLAKYFLLLFVTNHLWYFCTPEIFIFFIKKKNKIKDVVCNDFPSYWSLEMIVSPE